MEDEKGSRVFLGQQRIISYDGVQGKIFLWKNITLVPQIIKTEFTGTQNPKLLKIGH